MTCRNRPWRALVLITGLGAADALRQVPRPSSLRREEDIGLEGEDASLGDLQLMRLGGEDPHNATPAEDVDAWIRMSHFYQTLEENMYEPLLTSLRSALERVGAVTRAIDKAGDDAMLEGLRIAAAMGRRPLVVDVGTRFGYARSRKTVRSCVEAGAYVVLYSTEASDGARMAEYTRTLGTHEVWEYAMSNIGNYSQGFRAGTPVRYIPPGYCPELDVNVTLRRWKPSWLQRLRREKQPVGFLGHFGYRPEHAIETYTAVLGGRIRTAEDVWTRERLRRFLETYPLQLNMHKHQTCCPHDPGEIVAMEAFRLAPLLTNKACVVSTPVPEEDRRLWEGIVHFAEVDETGLAIVRLGDVQACQLEAARLYRERFDAAGLLRSSGFLKAWQPRGPSTT